MNPASIVYTVPLYLFLKTIRINVVLRFVLERILKFRYTTKSNLEVISMSINKLVTLLIIISLLTWNSNIIIQISYMEGGSLIAIAFSAVLIT